MDDEEPTLRTAYWHDARHTGMACRLVLEAPLPLREKARLLARHIGLYARQMMNLGRGSEWLHGRWFPARAKESRWAERGGFQAEEERTWTDWERAELARKVAAVKESLPELPVRPGFAVALREIADDVRRAGAEPIFVLAPSVRPAENQVLGLPTGVTVLAFNHPAEYPELYRWELHFDTDHLNEKGRPGIHAVAGATGGDGDAPTRAIRAFPERALFGGEVGGEGHDQAHVKVTASRGSRGHAAALDAELAFRL